MNSIEVVKCTFRPGPQDPKDSLLLHVGDKVVLSNPSKGWADGFNQARGAVGRVPLRAFQAEQVGFDFGMSSLRLATASTQISFQNEIKKVSRIALGSNCWIKGLKMWLDIKDNANLTDYHFLLGNSQIQKRGAELVVCWDGLETTIKKLLHSVMLDVKSNADIHLQTDCARIAFPIPYTWGYYQKILIRQAALSSGFSDINFIYQNTALAVYHNESQTDKEKDGVLLALSVGAMYTDITLFSRKGDILQTLAMEGIQEGGSSLTRALFLHVKHELNLDDVSSAMDRQLYNECELAKINLSTVQSVTIPISDRLEFTITRKLLESISLPLLNRLSDLVQTCLEKSNLETVDITQILICGEATSIIDPMLAQFTNATVFRYDTSSFAKGAVMQPEFLKFKPTHFYHYGVRVDGGMCVPIVSSRESFPQTLTFSPPLRATCATILLYEGKYLMASKNKLLSIIQIDSLPAISQACLEVTLDCDESQILNVTVVEASDRNTIIYCAKLNTPSSVELADLSEDTKFPLQFFGDQTRKHGVEPAPVRPNASVDVDIYFNQITKLHTLSAALLLKVAPECNEWMSRKLGVHLLLLQNWKKLPEHFSALKTVSGSKIESVKADLLSLVQSIQNLFPLQLTDSGISHTANPKWFQLQRDITRILFDLDTIGEGESRLERKKLVEICQSSLKFMELSESLLVSQAEILSSHPQDYSTLLWTIISTLDENDRTLPEQILQHMSLQSSIHHECSTKLTRNIPHLVLEKDIRGLVPAERASYAKLVTLSEEMNHFVKETHHKVVSTPLIVTRGKIDPQDNKACFIYEEFLLKILIRLDMISTLDHSDLRTVRKKLVSVCQEYLGQIDCLKKLYSL